MHAIAPKRKNTKKATTTPSPMPIEQEQENELRELDQGNRVVLIPLEKIKPHEHNRHVDSSESIDELAQSIKVLGQLEPATVRELYTGDHAYELLSGERRYRALLQLGETTIRAIIVHDNETDGLVRLAAANSNRKDLDPIERAELILLLMKPVEDGGSGLSREAAGKAVGLNSESGTKNAIRLLKLPKSVKELIQSEELSERAARKLIPFVDHPEILKEIEKNLVHAEHRIELAAEEQWPWWLEHAIENNTRPMDKTAINARDLVKGCYSSYPMLFQPTEEQLAKLAPFELQDGKHRMVLTSNCKLWDELQKPLVEAKFNKDRSPSAKKKDPQDKKLTPAQEKAESARKAKEAKERIDRYTVLWTTYALRCQLAQKASDETRYATLGYLVQSMNTLHDVRKAIDDGYLESNLKVSKVGNGYGNCPMTIPETNEYCWIEEWWGNMLWPLVPEGGLPNLERLPQMSGESVRRLATRCKVTINHFWKDAAVPGSHQHELLAMWLGRHTTDQLKAMCESMSKTTKAEKRSELVEFLLSQHGPSRLLPIPKGLIDGCK